MAQVYIDENASFRKKGRRYNGFGSRNPVVQKTKLRKCATSIVERVLCQAVPRGAVAPVLLLAGNRH